MFDTIFFFFSFRSIPLQVIVLPLSRIHLDELGKGKRGLGHKVVKGVTSMYRLQVTGIVHDIISI